MSVEEKYRRFNESKKIVYSKQSNENIIVESTKNFDHFLLSDNPTLEIVRKLYKSLDDLRKKYFIDFNTSDYKCRKPGVRVTIGRKILKLFNSCKSKNISENEIKGFLFMLWNLVHFKNKELSVKVSDIQKIWYADKTDFMLLTNNEFICVELQSSVIDSKNKTTKHTTKRHISDTKIKSEIENKKVQKLISSLPNSKKLRYIYVIYFYDYSKKTKNGKRIVGSLGTTKKFKVIEKTIKDFNPLTNYTDATGRKWSVIYRSH